MRRRLISRPIRKRRRRIYRRRVISSTRTINNWPGLFNYRIRVWDTFSFTFEIGGGKNNFIPQKFDILNILHNDQYKSLFRDNKVFMGFFDIYRRCSLYKIKYYISNPKIQYLQHSLIENVKREPEDVYNTFRDYDRDVTIYKNFTGNVF